MKQLTTRIASVAIGLLLASSGLALASSGVSYKGKTSQKRHVSFTVSGTAFSNLTFTIVDKCPGKYVVYDRDSGFPAMAITKGAFGGKFTNSSSATTVTVSGHVSGKTVSATLTDHTRNDKTHRMCSGKATFRLRPR